MPATATARRLRQFVLKPTVYCYHRCPYCDLRQDYYKDMVAGRKRALRVVPREGGARMPNPGHMPLDLALRTIDEAAALGMEELQLSATVMPKTHGAVSISWSRDTAMSVPQL